MFTVPLPIFFPFLWEREKDFLSVTPRHLKEREREGEGEGENIKRNEMLNILLPFLARHVRLDLAVWESQPGADPFTFNPSG